MHRLPLIALLFSLPLVAEAADEWPAFRGPTRDGVAAASGVPLEWGPDQNIAWECELPGSGWSSPVLKDGRLYVTAAVGEPGDEPAEGDEGAADAEGGVSLRVMAVDVASGALLWDVEALRPSDDLVRQMHQKNSLASPTVLIDGDRLIAHFGHMGTAALDTEGNVLWTQTTLPYEPRHGGGSSPALVDDLVVVSCDGEDRAFLVALDRESGEVRWKTERSGTDVERKFSFATPLVIDVEGKTQIISPASGYVAAYNPADGAELWRVDYGGGFSVVPRPVYTGGLLYVCSGFMRASLIAIDPTGAEGDVTETHVAWRHVKGVPNTPSVLVTGGLALFVSDRGVATCLDAQTGEPLWTQRLGGGFSASPVVVGDRVYFTNEEGVTYVVRAAREYELLAENDIGERTFASPAVIDGAMVIRTEGRLLRVQDIGQL